MNEMNATEARADFFKLLEKVTLNRDLAKIRTKNGNAIIMSEDEFSSIQETLYLMSVPGMAESIIEGMNTPASECAEIDWKDEL